MPKTLQNTKVSSYLEDPATGEMIDVMVSVDRNLVTDHVKSSREGYPERKYVLERGRKFRV